MTLSIAYVSGSICVVATDRRISGSLQDDEYGKTIALLAGDGTAAVSFAGLARAGRFNTGEWLADTLRDLGGPQGKLKLIIRSLAHRLAKKFQDDLTLKYASDRRLSVMFAGYGYSEGEYFPLIALVTNFQHPDVRRVTEDFRIYVLPLPRGESHISMAIGDYRSVIREGFERQIATCAVRAADVVEQVLVGSIRHAARAGSTIGKQVMTLTIDPHNNGGVRSQYHSSTAGPSLHFPMMVWAQPDTRITVKNMSIRAADDPKHTFPFDAPARNSRCVCGSGQKFKRCCGLRGSRDKQ